jgi:resuscitation-promoting factor RpfA
MGGTLLNSLDRHLRRPEEHDGLPFHPECPVCRDRAAGTLPSHGVLSRQTQAALAAGVLAVSAVGPSASLASPPGAPAAPIDPTLDPDWQAPGPEGESGTESAEEAPPALDDGGGGGEEERGAVESEPFADTVPELQNDEAPPAPAPTSAPAEQPAPVPADPQPPAPATGEPAAPGDVVETPTVSEPTAESAPAPKSKKHAAERERTRERVRQLVPRSAPAPPAAAPAPTVPTQAATTVSDSTPTTTTASAATSSATPIEGGSYRVRPGDSLWSIAERLLGAGASTGDVAREVHRLWTLNEDRIATGDPDLLRVGTVLKLR